MADHAQKLNAHALLPMLSTEKTTGRRAGDEIRYCAKDLRESGKGGAARLMRRGRRYIKQE